MKVSLRDLSVLAYANNFTLWHYKTNNDDIFSTNYFNNAADMMQVGDMIIANLIENRKVEILVVTDISSSNVKIAKFGAQ